MKLIGVTGKTGAGKTTFSNMLAENPSINVIHVDDILRQIKLKYFKLFMSADRDGEKTKINLNLKTFLYSNKLIFDLFMKFRARLIEKPLENEIERLKQEGNETIIIDDIFIKYHKKYKDLSKIFIVTRPFIERQEAVRQRDGLTKEEIVAADIAHFKENYKEIAKGIKIETISNNGTQEELNDIAQKVYEQQFIGFKDRYKQTNMATIPIEKNIESKVNTKSKNGKELR